MMKNLINNFFKDWVVFDAKLDRKSFLINISINLISQIVFTLLIFYSVFSSSGVTQLILGFLALIIYGCLQINFYSLIVRRLHDNNKSGWWILLFFISIVFSTGIRQSNSKEEYAIFIVLLISSISLFLYFLLSSDKQHKTIKKSSIRNLSLTKKLYLFRNYKILLILILIILTTSLFVFIPYKTSYYKCEIFGQTRSLVIKQYLPNSYSMSFSNKQLKPRIFPKKWCKSNFDSAGFVCKVRVPENIHELLRIRKEALNTGDTKSVKEVDEYIKSGPYKKYFYRFDPVITHLSEVISSSEEGEISNEIYQCEKTEKSL